MSEAKPTSEAIATETRERVMIATLPGAERLSPLSRGVIEALHRELGAVAETAAVRAVILRAEGRAFCAGHDLKEVRASEDPAFHRELFSRCGELMQAIADLPQPVIAEVQGIATAAGCQLVAACDLAVASEEARFATSGINVGLFCAAPAVPLTRSVGRKAAAEMLFTGEFIDASEAQRIGLVNRVAAPDALERETLRLAEAIAAKPPAAVRAGKRFLRRQLELGLEGAYRLAAETMAENMDTAAAREGIDAFLQKRKPDWD